MLSDSVLSSPAFETGAYMFIKSQFVTQVAAAFASYSRHFDYELVRLELQRLMYSYASLPADDAREMRRVVADDFHKAFRNSDPWLPARAVITTGGLPPPPKQALTLDEKAGLYLKAMFDVAPELFDETRIVLQSSVDRMGRLIHDKPALPGQIPCFTALQKFPILDESLRGLISVCMRKYPNALALYCQHIKDTPYLDLVDEDCTERYINSLHAGDMMNLAHDLATLSQIPSVWQHIDRQAGNLYVFGTFVPPVSVAHLGDEVESSPDNYLISYSAQTNFLALHFNSATYYHEEDATWIYMLEEDALKSVYVLLKHAEGVLEGTRQGQVATSQKWIDYQKEHLLPCLKTDIAALTEYIQDCGIRLPVIPDPVLPGAKPRQAAPIVYSGPPVLRRP